MDDREKLMERYDDAAFALMMDEYAEAEGEAILAEFRAAAEAGELPEMPEELDKACRNTIRKEYARRERRVRFKQFRRAAARIAVAVFAVIGILSTLVFSVEAWRIPVLNFMFEKYDTYTSIYLPSQSNTGEDKSGIGEYLAVLLPEGFYLNKSSKLEGIYFWSYKNDDGDTVQFLVSGTDGIHNIDIEDAQCVEIDLKEQKGILVEKDGCRIIWFDEEANMMYDIRATGIEKDDLVDIGIALLEFSQ